MCACMCVSVLMGIPIVHTRKKRGRLHIRTHWRADCHIRKENVWCWRQRGTAYVVYLRCAHVCVYTYILVCVCAYMCVCECVYVLISLGTGHLHSLCMYICACLLPHHMECHTLWMFIHIYVYMDIYICIYVCITIVPRPRKLWSDWWNVTQRTNRKSRSSA